jgi:hypothetical protein
MNHVYPPSRREGSNGDDVFLHPRDGAELFNLAWFELRHLVQCMAKKNAVEHRTLRMVYPGPEGRISHQS